MKINYEFAIQILQSELASAIQQLKGQSSIELVQKKVELDNAINWLIKGMEYQIDVKSQFHVLPDQKTATPSSEFRIIEDHETDNPLNWKEVKIDNEAIRPFPGDIVVIKPTN